MPISSNLENRAKQKRLYALLVIGLLLASSIANNALAQDKKSGPGGNRLCVPAADGKSWDCGSADNPPPSRPPPQPEVQSSHYVPPPPSMLALPEEQFDQEVLPLADEPAVTVQALPTNANEEVPAQISSDSTGVATDTTAFEPLEPTATVDDTSTPPAMIAAPNTNSELSTREVIQASEFAKEQRALQADSMQPVSAAETEVFETQATSQVDETSASAGAEAMETPVNAEVMIATESATELATAAHAQNESAFLALSAGGYMVQIARSASNASFPQQMRDAGIAEQDTYEIALPGDGKQWWVLLWGPFADIDTAKAAVAALPETNATYWPRRVAAMQIELRAK